MNQEYENEFKHAVDNVVKALLEEDSKDDYNEDLEPWEVYCERKKHLMELKTEMFRNRFVNGYKNLILDIKKGIEES